MMSINKPENLESDFDNLYITSNTSLRKRPRSLSESIIKGLKIINNSRKRRSLVLSSRGCSCKKDELPCSVIRPAKFNFSSFSKRSSVIRPAKLSVKKPKLLLLKPPTLIVPEEKAKPSRCTKFSRSSSISSTASFSFKRIFRDDKLNSQTSFKSLVSSENNEISTVFAKSSFKKLRRIKTVPAEGALTANKRENSTCSIEARMQSNVPVDCDETSIEELASYFDLFVHIPKKMSSMAEMMYI